MKTRIEPIELTDDELKAVAGGQVTFTVTNFDLAGGFVLANANAVTFTVTNPDLAGGFVLARANGAISNSFNNTANVS